MSASTTNPVVEVKNAFGGKIIGVSSTSCCTQVGREQTAYTSWLPTNTPMPQNMLSTNSNTIQISVTPQFPVSVADNAYLSIPLTNISPTGYTGAYGVTGSGALQLGDIAIVNGFAWWLYQTESLQGIEFSKKYLIGEHHALLNSMRPEQLEPILQGVGIDPVTYADNLIVSKTGTTYVRIPINLSVASSQIPLWLQSLTLLLQLRVNGGTQLIRAGPNSATDIGYVNVVSSDIKLYITGKKFSVAAQSNYLQELIAKGPVKYNYSENQFYNYPYALINAGDNLTPTFNTQSVFTIIYYQISPSQPVGAAMTYGTAPIIASTLSAAGVDLLSTLPTYQNYTDIQLKEQAYYIPNTYPQVNQNMYLLSCTRNPFDNLRSGCSDGQNVSNGSNLIWQTTVGGSGSYTNVQLIAYVYGKSTIVIDYSSGTIVGNIRNTAV